MSTSENSADLKKKEESWFDGFNAGLARAAMIPGAVTTAVNAPAVDATLTLISFGLSVAAIVLSVTHHMNSQSPK